MKTIRILLLFFLGSVFSISAMIKEKTTERIAFEKILPKFLENYEKTMQLSYSAQAETQKLKKYNLDNPQNLLDELRKSLVYDDPLVYLKNLQTLANFILFQDIWIQQIYNENYVHEFKWYLFEKLKKMTDVVDPQSFEKRKEGVYLLLKNIPPELANLLLIYPKLLAHESFDEKTLEVMFKLMFSSNSKLRDWGNILRLSQIQLKTLQEYGINVTSLLSSIRDTRKISILLPRKILESFLFLLNQLTLNFNEFGEKNLIRQRKIKERGEDIPLTQINQELQRKNKSVIAAYVTVREFYEKLYALLRKEMSDVIKAQIEKDKTLVRTLLSFHEVIFKNELSLLPKILPPNLPLLKNPADTIKLATFDHELEQAYEKWKQEGSPEIVQPITIRKMIRKPKKKPTVRILKEEEVQEEIQEPEELSGPAVLTTAADGSYILEGDETDQRITIYNPDHDTTEIIFKTANPNEIKEKLKPDYTNWVKQWFDDPQQAIKDQGYTDPMSKKLTEPRTYWKPIALHAFSQLVDEFLQKWGKKTEIANRRNPSQMDKLITLPGMMIYPDGSQQTGIYAYLIDSRTGKWYHRMFEPQEKQKLVQDLFEKHYFSPDMTGYYDVAFPELKRK